MSEEDEIDGTVRDFSRFGEGVVKTQIGQVFVPGVLPGERVALSGMRQQGKVMRTDKVRLLDRSSQRVEPPCPIVQRCGGCPLMIAAAPLQAKFKRELLERALAGVPGAESLVFGWVGARTGFAYRRRARLGWDASGPRLRIGYRRPRSDQIADVPSCAVLDPVLDAALGRVRAVAAAHLGGRGQIHLAMGVGERATVALRSDDAQPPELFRALEELVAQGELAGAALRTAGASADAKWGEPRELRKGADGEPLWGTIAGFSQAHDEVNAALVGRVLELARPADRDVLELFSGNGNFTIALAREAKSVLAVEQNADAADACRDNLRARGLSATVRTDDAESFRPPSKPDVVVLDPPRTGAPGAIKRVIHAGVPEVVYVSCDPPTLGRDVRALASAGYVLTDAIALDMFPQTAHVECVVRLERS
jgi:23S rRNA (uracil1939-C5)-methyltransferase